MESGLVEILMGNGDGTFQGAPMYPANSVDRWHRHRVHSRRRFSMATANRTFWQLSRA